MSIAKKIADGKIRIPCRLNYLHVFQPDPFYKDKTKYTAVLIIDKSDTDTVNLVKQTIREVHGALSGNMAFTLKADNQPLKDGPSKFPDNQAFANAYYMNVGTSITPDILRKEKDGTYVKLASGDIKDGDYGLALITIAPYVASGNKGISAYLNKILFVREGPALGGVSNEDAFGDADVDSPAAPGDDDLL